MPENLSRFPAHGGLWLLWPREGIQSADFSQEFLRDRIVSPSRSVSSLSRIWSVWTLGDTVAGGRYSVCWGEGLPASLDGRMLRLVGCGARPLDWGWDLSLV